MPIIQAQKKSVRQSERRRVFNDRRRRTMRENIKELKDIIATKDHKTAMEYLPNVYKAIDKAVKQGVIKANTGSRKKSQVNRLVKEIA
ncbi:30S ribosomal protein S20 [Candidatus Campbellbacteria bacterium]|nr:30S ribosomal protein S20 [Candidatus Campbellbacteria bacterium]|tara:strand:- start:1983 stop:2246 length:264 start_codon:yes stop_codon:yes gene_type:complete